MFLQEVADKHGLGPVLLGDALHRFIDTQHPEIVGEFDQWLTDNPDDRCTECPHCGEPVAEEDMEEDECQNCSESLLVKQS